MKRISILYVLLSMLSLTAAAQDDDLYFTPKKTAATEPASVVAPAERTPYYCGSSRDVDEYNRHGRLKSYYQKIGTDSLGNDIIEFHVGDGTYGTADPDSAISVYPGSERYYDEGDDYAYSRRMGRFDGFYGWYDPFFCGYWGNPYWHSYYGWYDPWCYGWGGWYDPWYYGWYGWGRPYYGGWYGWNGWYGPWRGRTYAYYNGPSGTRNRSFGSYRGTNRFDQATTGTTTGTRGTFGSRGVTTNRYDRNTNFGTNNGNARFGGQRTRTVNTQPTRTYTPSNTGSFGGNRGSFGGGGSFGGSRGGFGGGGGGSHGGFGGRR